MPARLGMGGLHGWLCVTSCTAACITAIAVVAVVSGGVGGSL